MEQVPCRDVNLAKATGPGRQATCRVLESSPDEPDEPVPEWTLPRKITNVAT